MGVLDVSYDYDYDPDAAYDECTADELRAEDRCARRYQAALSRHPDPRDPDYPGDIDDDAGEMA